MLHSINTVFETFSASTWPETRIKSCKERNPEETGVVKLTELTYEIDVVSTVYTVSKN